MATSALTPCCLGVPIVGKDQHGHITLPSRAMPNPACAQIWLVLKSGLRLECIPPFPPTMVLFWGLGGPPTSMPHWGGSSQPPEGGGLCVVHGLS